MNFSSTKRSLLFGLALAVTGSAGAAVAVTLAVASPSASQAPPVVAAVQTFPAAAAPSIAESGPTPLASATPATPATPAASAPPAAPAAAAPSVISPDQARAIAEHAGNGLADEVQAGAAPTGPIFDVSVTRSDGTDVEVVVDGHSGRILSALAEPQDTQDANTPDPQDPNAPDPQDGTN